MKRSVVAVVAASVLSLAGMPAAQVQGASGSPQRVAAAAPGLAGTPIGLGSQKDLHGYDIAMAPDGTAYLGWIAASYGVADRTVYLCVLPKGATGCQGGVKSTPSLGMSSADGLQVLPPVGVLPVTLVWFHDTTSSGGQVATSTVVNGSLTAAVDQATTYSNGSLLTAERGPGGAIWAVVRNAALTSFSIVQGLPAGPVKTVSPGFAVGKARLAFAGGKAVVVFEKYGTIGERLRVVYQPTTSTWSGVSTVAGTWSGGAFDVAAQGGVKLVASINNASYYPRIANWGGSAFGSFALTGDKNPCPRYSHDLFPDASGRLADVTFECSQVAVANHTKARTAAFVRFNVGGTPAGGEPQIGTNPRGVGWVAWARLSTPSGHTLLVAPVRLPAQRTTKTNGATYGVVTTTGPVSCLPAVQTTIGVKASGRNGWSLLSKALKLDGSLHATGLNGAGLAAGSTHTVTGSAKFRKNGVTRSLSASITFKACPNP